MPEKDTRFFPVHIGLLSPEHKEHIGSALWEFLWMIARTTKEKQDDGETWGIVLGGKPIKLTEIAEELGSSEHTVKKNIAKLKKYNYIESTRAPYGEIFRVRKSKKFINKRQTKNGTSLKDRETKNGLSQSERQIKNGLSEPRDRPNMVERQIKNGLSNKDIKDIKDIDIKQQQDIKESDVDVMENNPVLEYEKSFGFPSQILIQEFNFWIDSDESFFQEPEAIICEVIKEARKYLPNNPPSYVKSIIKKYHDLQLYTLEDVQEYNRKFEEKRNGGGTSGGSKKYRSGNGRAQKKSSESITGNQVGWLGKRD